MLYGLGSITRVAYNGISMVRVITIPVGPLQTNCFVVWKEGDDQCIVVDPGAEGDRVVLELARLGLKARYVFITHGHVDHIGAVNFVAETTGAEVLAHPGDNLAMKTAPLQAPLFGMKPFRPPRITRYVEEGDTLSLSDVTFTVVHTPGHSPGSVSLVGPGVVFVGDLIFMDSIGRTDIPGGDFETLRRSVTEKIFVLPDSTLIYPGHGPDTTVEREKRMNPFF